MQGQGYNKYIKREEKKIQIDEGVDRITKVERLNLIEVHWNLSKGGTDHQAEKVIPQKTNISSIDIQMNKVPKI